MSHDRPHPFGPATAGRSRLTERLLLPAAFITTAGNAFQITAASILVFRAGQNTLSVGWLFIAVSIPQVALSVIFGRMTDRFDRRTLSVASDLVSAVTAFALPVWLWLHHSATLGSYLCNFMLACCATLFLPASNALIKERIRDDRLLKYNARFEMATNSGMLLASSAAGFLVVEFGATPLFVFNAGTFVASAALTWLIGPKSTKAPAPAGATADADTTADDEASTAPRAAHPPLRRLGLLYISGAINIMVANVILTALILQTFHQSPWLVGVVDALAGAGFIVGATCHGWIAARFPSLWIALGCSLVCCVTIAIEQSNYIALMCAMPFSGFFFANFRIAARTMLMKASPEARVGRVFGTTQAVGLGLGIVATLGLSVLADRTSVPNAFFGLAGLVAIIAVSSSVSLIKPLRMIQARPAVPADAAVLVVPADGGEPA